MLLIHSDTDREACTIDSTEATKALGSTLWYIKGKPFTIRAVLYNDEDKVYWVFDNQKFETTEQAHEYIENLLE